MRKLALLFAVVLVVAACGDVDQADRDASAAAEAAATATTAAALLADHADDDHAEDEGHADEAAVEADNVDDDHAFETDHDDDDAVEEDHADEPTVEADRSIEVALAEFAFDADAFEVTAGETVEFIVTNTGFVEHEFRLSNEHRIEEHIAAGHENHDDGAMDAMGGHHEEGGDYILLVEPGETGSITITFGDDPSLYTEVACLIPGHYEAGMQSVLSYS